MSEKGNGQPSRKAANVVNSEQEEEALTQIQEQTRSAISNTTASLEAALVQAQVEAGMRELGVAQATALESSETFQALEGVIQGQEATAVGNQIRDIFEQEQEAGTVTFSPGQMLKDFKELSPWLKALLFICILILIVAIGYGTWELISFVWPHLMAFIQRHGPEIRSTGIELLTVLARSPNFFEHFESPLEKMAALAPNADTRIQEIPDLTLSGNDEVTNYDFARRAIFAQPAPILAIVRAFIAALSIMNVRRRSQ